MRYKNISNLLLVITGALLTSQTTAAPNDYDGKWNGFISCTAYVGNPALGAFTRNNAYAIENGVISAKYTTAEGKNTLTTEGTTNNKVAKLTINGVNATSNWTFNFTGNIPSVGKIMFTGDMVELGVKRRDCTMVFTVTDPAINSLAYKEANPAPVAKAETAKPTPAITPTTNTTKTADIKTVAPPTAPVVAPTVVAKVPATQPVIQPVPATIQAPVISPEQALKVEETPPVASQESQPQALQAPAPVLQTPPAKPFTFVDLINNTYVLIGGAIALLILAFFIIRAILRFLKRKAIEAANATKRKANEISEKINTEANAIKESVTQNINDLKDKANEISDTAKERANELSSIAQGKATELTEIAKAHAEKFSQDFHKEGGHKDKIKEASAQGLNMASVASVNISNLAKNQNEIALGSMKIQLISCMVLFVVLAIFSKIHDLGLVESPLLASLALVNFYFINRYGPIKYNTSLAVSLIANILVTSLIIQNTLNNVDASFSLFGSVWFWVVAIGITLSTYLFAIALTYVLFFLIVSGLAIATFMSLEFQGQFFALVAFAAAGAITFYSRKNLIKLMIGLMAGLGLGTALVISLGVVAPKFSATHILGVAETCYLIGIAIGVYLQHQKGSPLKIEASSESNISQTTTKNITNINTTLIDRTSKLVEDFNKDGGYKDNIKSISSLALNKAEAIARDLKKESQKINSIRKETLNINDGTLSKKELAIHFWGQLTKKQKVLIIGFFAAISMLLYHFGGSSNSGPQISLPQSNIRAGVGYELVCTGRQPQTSANVIRVDCSNRTEFVNALKNAWLTLRNNQIGGTVEDLCWNAYNDAKDLHPSLSFQNISDSFTARCNMGLKYIK